MFGAAAATAAPLTPEQALSRLKLSDGQPRKALSIAMDAPALVSTVETQHGAPAAYLFARDGGGWLLAGADDLALPLLGYGDGEADPSKMPPQLKWWLSQYARQIAWADSVAQSGAEHRGKLILRKDYASKSPAQITRPGAIKPLLTTTWSQDDPYNLYTPASGSEHTPTGCVATAAAQVMNYFEYPARATGNGHATFYDTQLTRSLNVTFDWGNMADEYMYTASTQAQKEAVANLMITCGYAMNMAYAFEGSGASDLDMVSAMVNTFNYDVATWLYYRDHYSKEEWEQMLIDNLKNVGPVYYSGQAPGGGHAFVCDGYDGNGLFHINWGWNGFYDAYFAIDALNPAGQGTGGYEGGYNTMQCAMLNARPPMDGTQRPQVQLYQFGEFVATISGNKLDFSMSENGWFNMTYVTATLELNCEMENMETGKKTYVGKKEEGVFKPYSGIGGYSASIPSSLPDGTYRARIVTKDKDWFSLADLSGADWLPSKCNYGEKNYAVVEMKGGVASIGHEESTKVEVVTATLNGKLISGKSGSYTASIFNGTDAAVDLPVAFALVTGDGYVMAVTDPVTYSIGSKQTVERTVEFTLQPQYGFLTNTDYYAVLYNPDEMDIIHIFGVTQVIEEDTQKPGVVSSMIMTPLYYGKQGTYSFVFSNPTKTALSLDVSGALITEEGDVMALDDNFHAITIGAGKTETFTLPLNFTYYSPDFQRNTEYIFAILGNDEEGLYLIDTVDVVSVETDPDAVVPEYVVDSFIFEGDSEHADPSRLEFSYEITCANTDITDHFLLGVWDGDTMNQIGVLQTDNYVMKQGVKVSDSVAFSFNSASPGKLYCASLHNSEGTQISGDVYFRINEAGAVESVSVKTGLTLGVNTRSRVAVALSDADIVSAAVFSPTGTLLAAPVEKNGHSATIDLSGLSGMVIVTVTDANGATATRKAML